uniref:PGG domain-containing protein n=1 Tax=Daucus carota subsp. sativus TaxID=79200 RepID=A0A162AZZ4_DAUCS
MAEENSRAHDDRPLWQQRSKIYKMLTNKDPEIIRQKKKEEIIGFLCECWKCKPAEPLDGRGNTLLHLLVICNYVEALERLLDESDISQEQLKKQNLRGETALHEAARHDNDGIVDLLLQKEHVFISKIGCTVPLCNCKKCVEAVSAKKNNLVSVRNELGETALYLAAASGKWKVFQKILECNGDDCMTQSNDGCTVLHAAIMGEYYRTATNILQLKKHGLATKCNKNGETPLNLLASSPSSFRSNSYYTTATMGKASFIPLQSLRVLFYTYLALARQLLEEEEDWSRYTYSADKNHDQSKTSDKANYNPLIQAIEMGIPELVVEILRYFPDAANSISKDGRNVFHYAAEHRGGDIYEMLKKSAINKDRMLLDVDNEGNTILHHATKTKPATNFSLGVANLMAWDIFWFQRIRHDCPPHLLHTKNNDGNTAEDLSLKDYKNKRQAAEKAVKEMNQGLMVVAALIATVSFTAVFTAPGGFDQSEGETQGTPLLLKGKDHHHDLVLFLSYVGLTFFASLIALGTLLSTQLSRFHLDDLYFALPLKYSIAISCLFLSSCSIFTTFLQALVLEDYMPPYYFTSLIIGCVIMGLVYVDSIYDVLTYIVEVLRHSRTYRSQERS